jgi:hypothetical protein
MYLGDTFLVNSASFSEQEKPGSQAGLFAIGNMNLL